MHHRDDRTRQLQRHADRDGHRRHLDDRGNHLPVHHWERHLVLHPARRHRGNRHRHRRHHRDGHPERHRVDRDVRHLAPDGPNAAALHPGWGEEASSREWDEVHPDRVPDGDRPDQARGAVHLDPQRDEDRPDRVPDEQPDRDAGPDAEMRDAQPEQPSSTGCYPLAAFSVLDADRPASLPEQQELTGRPVPVLPEQPSLPGLRV